MFKCLRVEYDDMSVFPTEFKCTYCQVVIDIIVIMLNIESH
jgi:hypothetical protein